MLELRIIWETFNIMEEKVDFSEYEGIFDRETIEAINELCDELFNEANLSESDTENNTNLPETNLLDDNIDEDEYLYGQSETSNKPNEEGSEGTSKKSKLSKDAVKILLGDDNTAKTNLLQYIAERLAEKKNSSNKKTLQDKVHLLASSQNQTKTKPVQLFAGSEDVGKGKILQSAADQSDISRNVTKLDGSKDVKKLLAVLEDQAEESSELEPEELLEKMYDEATSTTSATIKNSPKAPLAVTAIDHRVKAMVDLTDDEPVYIKIEKTEEEIILIEDGENPAPEIESSSINADKPVKEERLKSYSIKKSSQKLPNANVTINVKKERKDDSSNEITIESVNEERQILDTEKTAIKTETVLRESGESYQNIQNQVVSPFEIDEYNKLQQMIFKLAVRSQQQEIRKMMKGLKQKQLKKSKQIKERVKVVKRKSLKHEHSHHSRNYNRSYSKNVSPKPKSYKRSLSKSSSSSSSSSRSRSRSSSKSSYHSKSASYSRSNRKRKTSHSHIGSSSMYNSPSTSRTYKTKTQKLDEKRLRLVSLSPKRRRNRKSSSSSSSSSSSCGSYKRRGYQSQSSGPHKRRSRSRSSGSYKRRRSRSWSSESHKSTSSQSPLQKSHAARSCNESRALHRDLPKTTSRYVSKHTFLGEFRHGNNTVRKEAVVTTSYEHTLKLFSKKMEDLKNCSSDEEDPDPLSKLDLQVYDHNGTNFTKNRPNGDLNHPFYIHPEDAELYALRTKNQTPPVQALHEICVKCDWKLPTYLILPSQKGFKFAMTINDHRFITRKTAPQKKLARAETAKLVLQWLKIMEID